MGFGEVLDAAFQVFRRSMWQFVIAQAVVTIPITVIQVLTQSTPPTSGGLSVALSYFASQLPWTLLIGLLELAQIAAVANVAQQAIHGGAVDAGAAYAQALKRLPLVVLFGIVTFVIVAVGTVILIVPGVIALVWLTQGIFFTALEGDGLVTAMRRSYRLTAGYFWRVLGILFVSTLIVGILNFLASLLGTGLAGPGGGSYTVVIIAAIVNIVIGTFPLIALYVQHLDLRARKGISLESGD